MDAAIVLEYIKQSQRNSDNPIANKSENRGYSLLPETCNYAGYDFREGLHEGIYCQHTVGDGYVLVHLFGAAE